MHPSERLCLLIIWQPFIMRNSFSSNLLCVDTISRISDWLPLPLNCLLLQIAAPSTFRACFSSLPLLFIHTYIYIAVLLIIPCRSWIPETFKYLYSYLPTYILCLGPRFSDLDFHTEMLFDFMNINSRVYKSPIQVDPTDAREPRCLDPLNPNVS